MEAHSWPNRISKGLNYNEIPSYLLELRREVEKPETKDRVTPPKNWKLKRLEWPVAV